MEHRGGLSLRRRQGKKIMTGSQTEQQAPVLPPAGLGAPNARFVIMYSEDRSINRIIRAKKKNILQSFADAQPVQKSSKIRWPSVRFWMNEKKIVLGVIRM